MDMQINNLEFRTNDWGDRHPEIRVINNNPQLSKPFVRYTVLFFVPDDEGYSIQVVGDRIFNKEISRTDLWKLMEYGQAVCDAYHKLNTTDVV